MSIATLKKLAAAAALGVLLAQPAAAAPDVVNINSADAETIAAVLDGVGMSRAQAIVEHRSVHGEFADPYDLSQVKGIGDRLVELNEGRIKLRD